MSLATWPWPVLLFCCLHIIATAMRMRPSESHSKYETKHPTETNTNTTDVGEFAGGHGENIMFDVENCEFKKMHSATAMDRFHNELRFLEDANQNPLFKNLVPALKRVENIGGQPFMVMTDVVRKAKLKLPVIADFKLGLQSWKPDFHGKGGADETKRKKMNVLDSSTTTKALGVRATSIQLPPHLETWIDESIPTNATYRVAGRAAVKKNIVRDDETNAWLAAGDPASFTRVVHEYLPTPQLRQAFVERLQPFIETFKVQKTYRFTGASLLVYYDGEGAGGSHPHLGMVMIDFPHTIGSPDDEYGVLDEGVLTGLLSLESVVIELGIV